MNLDALEQQLMTIFAVKNDGSSITTLIYGIIMLNVIKYIIKVLPLLGTKMSELISEKTKPILNLPDLKPEIKSRIVFKRTFDSRNQDDDISDALLAHMCKQDSAKDLSYNRIFLVNRKTEFQVTNDIYVKMLGKVIKDGNIQELSFELFSYTLDLTKLKNWVNTIYQDYVIDKKNQFGDRRYFFEELIVIPSPNQPPAPNLYFTMTEFNTNKSLKNIYGKHVQVVKDRVDLFINHPEWYTDKGVPHTLGMLLHGPPGTGKTSLIKAIAKDTHRHIFNIKLRKKTTIDQLHDLFFNEVVKIRDVNGQRTVLIPLAQRIYVIEDIDCLSDIVLDRSLLNNEDQKEKSNKLDRFTPIDSISSFDRTMQQRQKEIEKSHELTLSHLLNLLDGVLEMPGRILIMTSNYPDKLDKALVRPGRVDINLRLGYCTTEMIQEMFDNFYDTDVYTLENLDDKEYTPAQVQDILCNNYNNSQKAFDILCSC